MQQYRCPNCGAALDYSVKFCSHCGNKLSWMQQPAETAQHMCPACNSPININVRFCDNCGTPLARQSQQQTRIPSSKPPSLKAGYGDTGGHRALRNTGIIILSLLLFLFLVAFAPAFMIDRTILNPDFVAGEVDRLNITSLVADSVSALPEEVPVEISDAISAAISKLEPILKQQFNSGIYSIYDYIKGKKDRPELTKILRSTILSNEFLYSAIDELDVVRLAKSMMPQLLPAIIPEELSDLSSYLYPAVEDFVAREEVWIKEQMKTITVPVADYLVGDIKNFNVSISLEPVKSSFKEIIIQHIGPSIADLGFSQKYINDAIDLALQGIPLTFQVRETMIGAHFPSQIASSLWDIELFLKDVRQYAGYFQTGYIVLIVLTILLIAGIILIYRQVKGAARTLGIVFLLSGAIDLAAILLLKNIVTEQITQVIADLPNALQLWILQFINNLSAPMLILSICFIAAGILAIITSLVWRPKEAS